MLLTLAMIAGSIPAQVFAEEIADYGDQEVPVETEETVEETQGDSTQETDPEEDPDDPAAEEADGSAETELTEETEAEAEDSADLYGDLNTQGSIMYEDVYYDDVANETVKAFRECKQYILLSSLGNDESVTLTNGNWYICDRNVTFNERVVIAGTVSIILINNYKLTCKDGINVGEYSTLNIYGEPRNLEETWGTLYAETNLKEYATIGGASEEPAGEINIYSGIVHAISFAGQGAAIGGGMGEYDETNGKGAPKAVNIYGGEVTAENNNTGAGIGGGKYAYISWDDGINIYGGNVKATANHGAGIGSGQEATGNNGSINIYGGTVTATGQNGGAGIGGGVKGSNGEIYICGGTVKAIGVLSQSSGAGIGSGHEAPQKGDIYIEGGFVYAVSDQGAGIGAGCSAGCEGTVGIDGGVVLACSTEGGAGIGGGKNGAGAQVTIGGGAVQAISRIYDASEESAFDKWSEYATSAYAGAHEMGDDAAYLFIELFAFIYDCSSDYNVCGAGIGGGFEANGNDVVITGGIVSASASFMANNSARPIGRGGGEIDEDEVSDGNLEIGDERCVMRVAGTLKEPVEYMNRVKACREEACVEIAPCNNTDFYKCERVDDESHKYICSYCGEILDTEQHVFDDHNNCTRCGEGATQLRIMYITQDLQGNRQYEYSSAYLNEDYTIRSCGSGPNGKVFIGWHLGDPNGDPGKMYYPEETIKLKDSRVYGFEAVYCKPVNTYYIDENGTRQGTVAMAIDSDVPGLTEGWYVLESDLDIKGLNISGYSMRGKVKLILPDDTEFVMGPLKKLCTNDSEQSLIIYGQTKSNGKLSVGELSGYSYTQYGGITDFSVVNLKGTTLIGGGEFTCDRITAGLFGQNGGSFLSDTFNGQGTAYVRGGKFTCDSLTTDMGLYIWGGNTDISSISYSGILPISLSWTDMSDSIRFGDIAADCSLMIADGKTFTDGAKTVTGELTGSDIAGKTLIPYDGLGVRLVGHRVSLEGDIGVWFYMDLDSSIAGSESAFMRFTVPEGDKTTTKDVFVKDVKNNTETIGGRTYYMFKCNVAAKDMGAPIKAQIIDGSRKGIEYSYSVSDYAAYLIEHASDKEEYAKAVPLVRAMLNYGAYAQRYFGITENVIDADPEAIASVTAADINKPYQGGVLPSGVTFAGASLSMKGELTMSLYLKSDATLRFACGDMTVDRSEGSGYQVARLRDIPAALIGEDYTIDITSDDGSVTGSVTYNPLTYCYNVLSAESGTYGSDLENVCKALYVYYGEVLNY